MRAITYQETGEPNVLKIVDLPIPIPQKSQLLVRVKAAGLNRADILQRRGKYPPPAGESDILGLEIAGEIIEIGQDVLGFKTGQRVFGLVGSGGYAEYCIIDAQNALIIPDNISFIEAAAIPEAFLTANEALFTLGDLKPYESILIHAGGSGVGSAAIQLANVIGANVFTTVGNDKKIDKVKNLGANKVINYKNNSFVEMIHKSQEGVDVILDFIGAAYLESHLELLNSKGRLICVGMMGGSKTEVNLNLIIKKQLQVKGLIMRSRSIEDKRRMVEYFEKKWLPFFVASKMYAVVDTVFAFDKVQEAHTYMESNRNVGKIILQID